MAMLDSSSSWASFCPPRGREQPCAAWAGCRGSPEPCIPLPGPSCTFLPLFPCAHSEQLGDDKNKCDASLQVLRAQLAAGCPRAKRRRASELHVQRLGHVGLGKCLGFESWVKGNRAQQNGLASRGLCAGRGGADGGKTGWDFASRFCTPLFLSKILGYSERDRKKPSTPRNHHTTCTPGAV